MANSPAQCRDWMTGITAVTVRLRGRWAICSLQTGATCPVHIDQWSSRTRVGSSDQCSLRQGWKKRDIPSLHEKALAWDQTPTHRSSEADGWLELSGCSGGLFMLVNQNGLLPLHSCPQSSRKRKNSKSLIVLFFWTFLFNRELYHLLASWQYRILAIILLLPPFLVIADTKPQNRGRLMWPHVLQSVCLNCSKMWSSSVGTDHRQQKVL